MIQNQIKFLNNNFIIIDKTFLRPLIPKIYPRYRSLSPNFKLSIDEDEILELQIIHPWNKKKNEEKNKRKKEKKEQNKLDKLNEEKMWQEYKEEVENEQVEILLFDNIDNNDNNDNKKKSINFKYYEIELNRIITCKNILLKFLEIINNNNIFSNFDSQNICLSFQACILIINFYTDKLKNKNIKQLKLDKNELTDENVIKNHCTDICKVIGKLYKYLKIYFNKIVKVINIIKYIEINIKNLNIDLNLDLINDNYDKYKDEFNNSDNESKIKSLEIWKNTYIFMIEQLKNEPNKEIYTLNLLERVKSYKNQINNLLL